MNANLIVENIKCGGCATCIESKLKKIVDTVHVDVESGEVQFEYDKVAQKEEVEEALKCMGYAAQG